MLLRIGEVAKRLGIHPDTLRRLEQKKIIAFSRDWAGQRRIDEEMMEQIREILFSGTRVREARQQVSEDA